MNNKRKKKIVEIYFILYLAALVLLIPGKENGINTGDNLSSSQRIFQLPFSLKPEKNTLNATVKLDSNGFSIISIDSTNTVFYTGQVKGIKFDVSVEDRNTRQFLILDNQKQGESDFFKYTTDEATQSLKFYWDPPFYDKKSKTYVVKIEAQAISTDPLSAGLIVEDRIQFSLNLNYITDYNSSLLLAVESNDTLTDEAANPQDIANSRLLLMAQTNLFLSPREEVVKSIAYTQWENEISIFGLDPKFDLRRDPELKIIREPDNKIGGSAKIAGFTGTGLLIKGETPGYGVMKVQIALIRHADGKEAIREFRVQPQLIEDPKFEQTLYPDIRYTFDPKLPIISGQKTYSILKSSDGKTLASNESGSAFAFTPSISDTGKTLYFERYVDKNLIGQRHTIRVMMYPNPEIVRVSETAKNTVRIFTNCYGIVKNRENYISSIDVLSGNVKVREIIGAQKNDEGTFLFKQVFELTPSNSSSEFSFKIRAIASNGQKSEIFSYPQK